MSEPYQLGEWAAGPPVPPDLGAVLEASRQRRLVGGADISVHVAHAAGFASFLEVGATVVDLGSGGGLPGLVLAVGRPDLQLCLVDSARRRTRFLGEAVTELHLGERARVVWGRAEELGRDVAHRGVYDAVVARSFAPPAVTAECGRPFLRSGGLLVVSEPPGPVDDGPSVSGNVAWATELRWPPGAVEALGLRLAEARVTAAGRFQSLEAVGECPVGLPRRTGVPERRPLF